METGIIIMNLEGSDILKNNFEGIMMKKDYKGVFTDSLLLDKLKQLGLNISKNETTRDIINVQFSYGYTPKVAKDTSEIEDLEAKNNTMLNTIKTLETEKKNISKRADKKPFIDEIRKLRDAVRENKIKIRTLKQEVEKLCLNKSAVREKIYKEGFKLDFYKKDKTTKEYVLDESIDYVLWFRTPSKSRIGDAMFINKKLYSIKTWQRMGLELPEGEKGKVVEMAAYESLTSSHKEDEIIINPDNILVINDIDSYFSTNCAIVYTDANGECHVKRELHKIKNTLFDGQALLEDRLFLDNSSFKLLRQHFFKACAFRTHISKFMKDWCEANGKDYNTYSVKDRYGNNINVKDILMIVTENAMKWEKMKNASYELWKQKVKEDNNVFGICKVDHKSKYGEYQRMSYQMINTLDVDSNGIQVLAQYTTTYVNNIKADNDLYVHDYLSRNISEINSNAMMIDLYKKNKEFAKSEFFRDYKKKDISKYVKTLRNGKLLAEGDNLTIIGSPYIMLLHSVGAVPVVNGVLEGHFADPTLPIANDGDDQYISVYTSRFNEGEYLAAFRNPHNSPNNIGYHKVFKHEYMEKYFNFNDNIMAVNMIQTEEQDLKNGEDQDSDFCFVTNNSTATKAAKKVFRKYPCIVNDIKKDDRTYENTIENSALIDNELAKSKNDIGLSSNLAQLAMSWYWNDQTDELADIVCIMSVLAQCAIDNSKRKYKVDINKEIKRIGKLECMKKHTTQNNKGRTIKAKPSFWKYIDDKTNEESLISCNCPMSYLQSALDAIEDSSRTKDTINNIKFIKIIDGKADDKQITKIEKAVKEYDDEVKKHNDLIKKGLIEENEDKWNEEQEVLQYNVVNYISKLKVKEKTMQILIAKALSENGMNRKYKKKLLNALYKSHKETFLAVFKD